MRHSCLAICVALAMAGSSLPVAAVQASDAVHVLFVGNSFTFGRVDPVLSYNAANVTDLTRPNQPGRPSFDLTAGTRPYEPHPWGGVPGIVMQMTAQKSLNYRISLSTRNAASLRGHFLNTANAWDLQSNLAHQKWDKVVLQDLSDEPLPAGRSDNANLALFNFYANKIQDYVHNGVQAGTDSADFVLNTTESLLWGGPTTGSNAVKSAKCRAGSGLSQTACNADRTIKGNPNENPAAEIFLYQTWARPDMAYDHPNTVTDPASGAISIATGAAAGTTLATYPSLEAMTTDLHDSYNALLASNPAFKAVAPVGNAFMQAVADGVATRNPYAENALTDGKVDLWWDDNLHASKYGSYLSALTLFGTLTGLDPASLGAGETAALDLGISSADALALQRIASDQLGYTAAPVPEPATALMLLGGLAALGSWRQRRGRQA